MCFKSIQLLDVVALEIDVHIHFSDLILLAACIEVVILLVLAHVAATHQGILMHELLLKLGEEAVIAVTVVLN